MTKSINALIVLLLHTLSSQAKDPGLPVQNPTISYWQTPPLEGIADRQTPQLPSSVDVVIIGSGMTGTSIAHYLLKNSPQDQPLRIAMLEARQACSGATGRNGGHIRPSPYREYDLAKRVVSKEEAKKITRLRNAHVDALISAANELDDEGREASEARPVDSIDAFFDQASYQEAVKQLDVLKKEVPDLGFEFMAFDQQEARNLSLLWETTGMITGSPKVAGAIWPYRFVTHTLKSFLEKHSSFSLDTNTPVLNVSSIDIGNATFEITTSRGKIQARHVIHAANAWTPHLVPGLETKISGGRLHMSAQVGGTGIPKAGEWPSYSGNGSLSTGRAWSLIRGGLDYVVQMPRNGEFMFGGGEMSSIGGGSTSDPNTTNVNMDDGHPPDHGVAAYLGGALPNYFGYDKWGSERTDFPSRDDPSIFSGRTKRVWTGIEGSSSDGRPLVGMIPASVTRRPVRDARKGAEWISAAYDGEGMCFAWLCGQALGLMLLGGEKGGNQTLPDWFPLSLQLLEERMKNGPGALSTMGKRHITRMGTAFGPEF